MPAGRCFGTGGGVFGAAGTGGATGTGGTKELTTMAAVLTCNTALHSGQIKRMLA